MIACVNSPPGIYSKEMLLKIRCGGPLRLFLLAWLIIALLSACQKQEEPASSVLVRVNERVISFDRFEAEFSRHLTARGIVAEETRLELKRSFLAQKINRELILSAADRAGIDLTAAQQEAVVAEHRKDYATDDFKAMLQERNLTEPIWRRQLLENRRIEEAISRLAYSDIDISQESVATYYQQQKKDFNRPQQVRARQITLANEAEGQKVLGQLRQGLEFAEAARRFSISPDAEQGGDLGFFGRGQMPDAFDAVVFELPIGRISELVKSEYGYHLFLVEERRPAQRLTLEQVQDEIAARLRADKEEDAYRNWLQNLRSQATIEVDWTLL